MSEAPNYFAVLTAEILHSKKITNDQKILMAHITTLTQSTGECFASNQYFSKVMNVSDRSIQRWLKVLEEQGFIERVIIFKIDSKEVESRHIVLNTGSAAENAKRGGDTGDGGGDSSVRGGGDRDVTYNNIKTINKKVYKKALAPPIKYQQGFEYPSDFEYLWKSYRVGDKYKGYRAWYMIRSKYTEQELIEVLEDERNKKIGIRHMATIFNSDIDEVLRQSGGKQYDGQENWKRGSYTKNGKHYTADGVRMLDDGEIFYL